MGSESDNELDPEIFEQSKAIRQFSISEHNAECASVLQPVNEGDDLVLEKEIPNYAKMTPPPIALRRNEIYSQASPKSAASRRSILSSPRNLVTNKLYGPGTKIKEGSPCHNTHIIQLHHSQSQNSCNAKIITSPTSQSMRMSSRFGLSLTSPKSRKSSQKSSIKKKLVIEIGESDPNEPNVEPE